MNATVNSREGEKPGTFKTSAAALALALFCLAVAVFVLLRPLPNRGFRLLFLLPLSFGATLILFRREYAYFRRSFGLSILYATAVVRYVATPFLMALSRSAVQTVSAGEGDYFYAVIVEVFELFATMIVIKIVWPRHLRKTEKFKNELGEMPESGSFRLSWLGALFIALLVLLLIVRGHLGNVLSHLSTWFNRVKNTDELYGYDMMAFNIVKVFLFVSAVSLMKLVYSRTKLRLIPFIIAVAAGLLNTMFFEYSERTDLAVLIIASFFVLRFAFPKERKNLFLVFGVGGVLLVAAVFLEGTLHYKLGESVLSIDFADYSKMAELYTTGPSIIANAHKSYDSMRERVTLLSFLKEIVRSCDLFTTLPFLRFINNAVAGGKYSVELYVESIDGLPYIFPNHSLAALYTGRFLCWIVEPLIILFNIKLLGWFERLRYKINDLLQVYAVYGIVTMVAMGVFTNNLTLMLHSFSSLPLWLLLFSYINNLGRTMKIR